MNFWTQLFKAWITLFTRQIVIQWISVNKTNHAIRWLVIYPVDSVIRLLNNPDLANFSSNAKKQNGDSYKRSALMGIRFGLQRHFPLKRQFHIISDGQFSKSNPIFEAAIVELKRQGFSKVKHHISISKEDLEKIPAPYNPSSPDPKSLQ